MKKILIIEDDTDLLEGLTFALGMDGYEVASAATKRKGHRLLQAHTFDLIILDCNLPDGSGFDFCSEVRAFSQIPILMLTARDTEMDEIKALELGMDDYMAKPFSLAVLKARMKKILQHKEPPRLLESGKISVNLNSCQVFKNGEEIFFSKIEYKLLLYLLEHKNQILSKEQILDYIWDNDGKFVDANTVSVNIRRVRTKIEDDPANPLYIQTVHGLGYLWKEESL